MSDSQSFIRVSVWFFFSRGIFRLLSRNVAIIIIEQTSPTPTNRAGPILYSISNRYRKRPPKSRELFSYAVKYSVSFLFYFLLLSNATKVTFSLKKKLY